MAYQDNSTSSIDILFSFRNVSRSDPGAIIPAHIRSPIFFVVGGSFCVLGLVGNSLFIASFLFQKKMRTVSNYLICLLSSADLLTCLGFNLVYMIMVAFKWTMFTCWIWLVSAPLFPILSMYTQLLISIDRMTLVTQPINVYRRWFTKKLCTGYALGGWLAHTFMIVFVVAFGKMPPSEGNYYCSSYEDLNAVDYQSLFIYSGFSMVYFGIAVTFYGKLLVYVRQKRIEAISRRGAFIKTSMTLLKLCILSMSTVVIPPIVMYFGLILNSKSIAIALDELAILLLFPGFCVNPLFYGHRIQLFKGFVQKWFCSCKKNNKIAPLTSVPLSNELAQSNTQMTQVQV